MKITVDISECLSSTQEIEVPDNYNESELLNYVKEQVMLPSDSIKVGDWFVDDFSIICVTDTWRYNIVPHEDLKYIFKMTPKEYERTKKLYEEKGTLSYEFYPIGGIGYGLKIHTKDEVIDVTDLDSL